jgi:diaminopropionate ammonia-lyase
MTTTTAAWTANDRDRSWSSPDQDDAALDFHRSLAGYEPTALIELPELARELGVAAVFAKDESTRLGMPAFKALGASWAVHRALEAAQTDTDAEVVTATDGNHGRAVARFAREAGRPARIFVPAGGIHPSAVAAIRGEGAEVVELEADYDQTVAAAADYAAANGGVLVQDTAWEGYEEVPGWIVDGYSTLFREIDAQLREAGHHAPDLVTVPTGVGSLLQAALAHYRRAPATMVRGWELAVSTPRSSPSRRKSAACMGPSLEAGHPVTVETGTDDHVRPQLRNPLLAGMALWSATASTPRWRSATAAADRRRTPARRSRGGRGTLRSRLVGGGPGSTHRSGRGESASAPGGGRGQRHRSDRHRRCGSQPGAVTLESVECSRNRGRHSSYAYSALSRQCMASTISAAIRGSVSRAPSTLSICPIR